METEMARDVESARLFRLLTKLSTVVDRAELNGDESWSEYGDRYMLKLFRDYVFHQVGIQSVTPGFFWNFLEENSICCPSGDGGWTTLA